MGATDNTVADRGATVQADRCVCIENMLAALSSSVPVSESVHAVGNQRTTFSQIPLYESVFETTSLLLRRGRYLGFSSLGFNLYTHQPIGTVPSYLYPDI
jgi:hypothetical protein